MNIFEKINEVMKRIEYLTKDDKVEFGTTKYKAISEEKVTTAVRKELVNLGIVIAPIEQTMNVTELIRTDKSVNQRADVNVKYRVQNIENTDDYIIVSSSGSGVDTQDKAIGKAMTYAYKYMLLRTFAIPTGEDPDKISSAETDAKIENELTTTDRKINRKELDILNKTIAKYSLSGDRVNEILNKYGYETIEAIDLSNYAKIGNEMSK